MAGDRQPGPQRPLPLLRRADRRPRPPGGRGGDRRRPRPAAPRRRPIRSCIDRLDRLPAPAPPDRRPRPCAAGAAERRRHRSTRVTRRYYKIRDLDDVTVETVVGGRHCRPLALRARPLDRAAGDGRAARRGEPTSSPPPPRWPTDLGDDAVATLDVYVHAPAEESPTPTSWPRRWPRRWPTPTCPWPSGASPSSSSATDAHPSAETLTYRRPGPGRRAAVLDGRFHRRRRVRGGHQVPRDAPDDRPPAAHVAAAQLRDPPPAGAARRVPVRVRGAQQPRRRAPRRRRRGARPHPDLRRARPHRRTARGRAPPRRVPRRHPPRLRRARRADAPGVEPGDAVRLAGGRHPARRPRRRRPPAGAAHRGAGHRAGRRPGPAERPATASRPRW